MNATCGTCQLEKFPGLFRGRGGGEKDQSFTFNPEKTNGLLQESTTYQ